jgi:hypothetical protein
MPSPARGEGAITSASVLAAHPRPSFANTATFKVRRREWPTEKEGVVPAFSPSATSASPVARMKRQRNPGTTVQLQRCSPDFTSFHPATKNKGSGTPTDALPSCRAATRPRILRGCARLSAFHRGSDPRDSSSQRPSFRPCFLGRGGAPICHNPPSGGRADAVCAGVTRPRPVPVQRAPRGPVCSAGRLMPEAARERFAMPPAGTALAPLPRCASGAGPLRERDSQGHT